MENVTVAQAAYVVGESLNAFKKTLENTPVRPIKGDAAGRLRMIPIRDLVYLHAYPELKRELTETGRKHLYQAMAPLPPGRRINVVEFGKQRFDFSENYKLVIASLKALRELSKLVDESGPEPLIKGTRIEVHRIAALLAGGASIEEVLDDYPSLISSPVKAAEAYAAANPKVGRPYPKKSAKRVMAAVDFSALDDVS